MRKKTLKGWEKSGLELKEYLGPAPCEIDEALSLYIVETTPPEFLQNSEEFGFIGQCGEADDIIDGIYYHMTVKSIGNKDYYLGILPSFTPNND